MSTGLSLIAVDEVPGDKNVLQWRIVEPLRALTREIKL